tara:strand:+ start:324 stop:551 length:228 start_codon:yes stop_codon:yes gene_type:complete
MSKKEIVNSLTGESEFIDLTAQEETEKQESLVEYQNQLEQAQADKETKDNLKASAKAKLIAGDPLTAEEADTIVL